MTPTLEKPLSGSDEPRSLAIGIRLTLGNWWKQSKVGPVLACVVVFVILFRLIKAVADLPEESFQQSFLFAALLKHLPQLGWRLIGWLGFIGILCWRRRNALGGWDYWDHGAWIRFLMALALLASAWPTATYAFNHQFNQWHALDRLLVLLLGAGVLWRPVFVIPYVVQVTLVTMQFTHPIGGFTWMTLDQSLNMMLMFGAFHLVSIVRGSKRTSLFFYLALVVAGLHYWPSGYAKFREGWLLHNQLQFFVTNTHANGWLGWLSPEPVGGFARSIEKLSPMMKMGAIIFECGAVFILWRRKAAMFITLGWIGLHFGVFVISGICFWQWSLLDAGLLLALWRADAFRSKELFTTGGCLLAMVLIGSSFKWHNVGALTWFDARGTYTYRFYAVGDEGRKQLPPRFFAPYEVQMNLNGFAYLSEEPVMGVMWGASRRSVAERLYASPTREGFLAAERELAADRLDEGRKEVFRQFLIRHAERWNARPKGGSAIDFVRPPNQIITGHNGTIPDEDIRRIEVVQVLSFFDGTRYEELREREVLAVDIPLP